MGVGCWTPLLELPREWEQPDENLVPPDEPQGSDVRRSYFDTEGTHVSREVPVLLFSDGHLERHGLERGWYKDGSLRLEQVWERDRRVGVTRHWAEDGTLLLEVDRGDGATPAPMRFWHPNGVLAATGQGIDGVKEGHWTTWYENGAQRSAGSYRDGLRDGPWSFWDETGTLIEQGEYLADLRVGEWYLNLFSAPPAEENPEPAPEELEGRKR